MDIIENVDLSALHSFGLKSVGRCLVRIRSDEDLHELSDKKHLLNKAIFLGEGTNIVFGDFVGRPLVRYEKEGIQIQEEPDHWRLQVGAATNWHELVEKLLKKGIDGLENLGLIPGSLGAAPVQNIGAYGVEFATFCEGVRVFDFANKQFVDMPKQDLKFSYRHSVFKEPHGRKVLITRVDLRIQKKWKAEYSYPSLKNYLLEKGNTQPNAQEIFEAVCSIRRSKLPDPAKLGNAGSFFKNPIISEARFLEVKSRFADVISFSTVGGNVKIPAAWLIEKAGFKGKRFGPVGSHEKQALCLVNYGGATGDDIISLATEIEAKIKDMFGIDLEREVRIVSG